MLDRRRGALIGLAIGDALGAALAGMGLAWRRRSLWQVVLEVLGALAGAAVGAIPGVFFLCAGLSLAGTPRTVPVFTWPTIAGIGLVVAGAILGLWYAAGATGGWAPVAAALAGGALGVGASVGAFILMENSGWIMCWLALAPVSIAYAAVGGHALAGGT